MSITTLLILSCITTHCQTTTNKDSVIKDSVIIDTCTCIPNSELRQGAILIERGKEYAQLYRIEIEKVKVLQERIAVKEDIIQLLELDTLTNAKIIKTYKDEIKIDEDKLAIAVKSALRLDKLLRRQKRLTIIGMIASAALAVSVMMLIK